MGTLSDAEPLTELLNRMRHGDNAAAREVFAVLEPELRVLARRWMRSQSAGHTLQTTALINEAYLRLARAQSGDWDTRRQFYAAASKTMRTVLIDHARRTKALKRGAGAARANVPMDSLVGVSNGLDLVELHDAISVLGTTDPTSERVAEMRVFGGFDHATIADVLGVSERTAERKWAFAKAWIRRQAIS